MRNQKGEVITGAMVVIMVVMMLFGGMHMMHGGRDHRHGDDHDGSEHKHDQQHDQQKEGMHQMHNDQGVHADTPADTQKENK